jgi:hypothetical protein
MESRTLALPLVRRITGALAVGLMAGVLAVSAYVGATGTGSLAAKLHTGGAHKPMSAPVGHKILASVSTGSSGGSSSPEVRKPR